MTDTTKMRIVAFVRTIAHQCDTCHVRGTSCYDCVANRAKLLLADVSRDEAPSPEIDYSFYARVKEIKRILSSAGKPLLARDIDLKHTCSPQLKCWTLNQMVYRGYIGRKFAFRSKSQNRKKVFFFYYMKNKETK